MGDFTIQPLQNQQVISVVIEGSLTLDDVDRLRGAQRSALRAAGWKVDNYDLLVYVVDAQLEDTVVASAFKKLRTDPERRPSRMAFVHGASSTRSQVRRLWTTQGDAVFANVTEALEWLKRV